MSVETRLPWSTASVVLLFPQAAIKKRNTVIIDSETIFVVINAFPGLVYIT